MKKPETQSGGSLKPVGSAFPPDTGDDFLCNVRRLRDEIKWLRGIIARNAMQRLKGEDATEMFVTANDVRDSLEILYTWQRTERKLEPPVGSASPRFYWKQCYELGDRVHWALCDTQTDGEAPPHRVSCLEMILWDHWSPGLPEQLIPKLIVELLTAHYSQNVEDKTYECLCEVCGHQFTLASKNAPHRCGCDGPNEKADR